MFTLEIDGRAIAVTNGNELEAQDFFDDEDFRADLRELTSGGRPLWDGKGPLKVRPASGDEIDVFEEVIDDDDDEEEEDDDELDSDDEGGINVVFIVPIDEDDEADAGANG